MNTVVQFLLSQLSGQIVRLTYKRSYTYNQWTTNFLAPVCWRCHFNPGYVWIWTTSKLERTIIVTLIGRCVTLCSRTGWTLRRKWQARRHYCLIRLMHQTVAASLRSSVGALKHASRVDIYYTSRSKHYWHACINYLHYETLITRSRVHR